jgi:hypothetical protein
MDEGHQERSENTELDQKAINITSSENESKLNAHMGSTAHIKTHRHTSSKKRRRRNLKLNRLLKNLNLKSAYPK